MTRPVFVKYLNKAMYKLVPISSQVFVEESAFGRLDTEKTQVTRPGLAAGTALCFLIHLATYHPKIGIFLGVSTSYIVKK